MMTEYQRTLVEENLDLLDRLILNTSAFPGERSKRMKIIIKLEARRFAAQLCSTIPPVVHLLRSDGDMPTMPSSIIAGNSNR